MHTQKDIDDFYEHLASLKLKFPVADLHRATKYSKGRISEFVNQLKPPSKNFLKKYYDKFPKGSQTNGDALMVQLMQKQNSLMEMQNRLLDEMKTDVKDKVKTIDINLKSVLGEVDQLSLHVESAREVVLESLARLEKKPEHNLRDEADSRLRQIMKERSKQNRSSGRSM